MLGSLAKDLMTTVRVHTKSFTIACRVLSTFIECRNWPKKDAGYEESSQKGLFLPTFGPDFRCFSSPGSIWTNKIASARNQQGNGTARFELHAANWNIYVMYMKQIMYRLHFQVINMHSTCIHLHFPAYSLCMQSLDIVLSAACFGPLPFKLCAGCLLSTAKDKKTLNTTSSCESKNHYKSELYDFCFKDTFDMTHSVGNNEGRWCFTTSIKPSFTCWVLLMAHSTSMMPWVQHIWGAWWMVDRCWWWIDVYLNWISTTQLLGFLWRPPPKSYPQEDWVIRVFLKLTIYAVRITVRLMKWQLCRINGFEWMSWITYERYLRTTRKFSQDHDLELCPQQPQQLLFSKLALSIQALVHCIQTPFT